MAPRGAVPIVFAAAVLAAVSAVAGQAPQAPAAIPAQNPAQNPALESRQLAPAAIYGQRMRSDLHLERLGAVRAILDDSLWDEAKPLLLEAMKDGDPVVRMVSAFNLGNIRTDVASARQALAAGLQDEDAHVRRFSALALGSMGRDAAGTEQALRSLASDPDPAVQKSAAWAAKRVESGAAPMPTPEIVRGGAATAPPGGLAGTKAGRQTAPAQGAGATSAAAPRPGSTSAVRPRRPQQKPDAKAPEEPPEGRVYFVPGIHEVDESGITATKRREYKIKGTLLNLFGAIELQYLDLKQAWLYRQDAEKRGLDVTVPLPELLKADPEARSAGRAAKTPEQPQRFDFTKLFGRYDRDYVVAIACNGQTRFAYRRFDSQGKKHEWGGLTHLGMLADSYRVEVSLFASDGFRLDFAFDIGVENEPVLTPTELAPLKAIHGPQDVSPELRRRIAQVNPQRKNDSQLRARDTKQLATDIVRTSRHLMENLGWTAGDLQPFLQDAAALLHRAKRLDPAVALYSFGEDVGGVLIARCEWLNTPTAYAVSADVSRLFAESTAGVPYNSPRDEDRWAWGIVAGSSRTLADCAITYRNDIRLFWRHMEERLRHVNALWRPEATGGGKLAPIDPARERDTWPQPGWWRSDWDGILPPELEPTNRPAVRPPRRLVPSTTSWRGCGKRSARSTSSGRRSRAGCTACTRCSKRRSARRPTSRPRSACSPSRPSNAASRPRSCGKSSPRCPTPRG
jgi:hypothetical protein